MTPAQWFDVSQFSQPAPYTFGNTPRTLNGLRSDGARNLDIGLNKTTQLTTSRTPFLTTCPVLPANQDLRIKPTSLRSLFQPRLPVEDDRDGR
jgi:hypothetical protein